MFSCWDPFTGEQRCFHMPSELHDYEEGLQLMAGNLVEPECPACDTREPHDVDQERCTQLQTRRATQQRAGCYHGPISPFDLACGQALRALFPTEYAAHRRHAGPEFLGLLTLPAVRLALAKFLRLPDVKALKCCASGLRDAVELERATAYRYFERLLGPTAMAVSPLHGVVTASPAFLYHYMPVYDAKYGYAQATMAPNFGMIQALDFPDTIDPAMAFPQRYTTSFQVLTSSVIMELRDLIDLANETSTYWYVGLPLSPAAIGIIGGGPAIPVGYAVRSRPDQFAVYDVPCTVQEAVTGRSEIRWNASGCVHIQEHRLRRCDIHADGVCLFDARPQRPRFDSQLPGQAPGFSRYRIDLV